MADKQDKQDESGGQSRQARHDEQSDQAPRARHDEHDQAPRARHDEQSDQAPQAFQDKLGNLKLKEIDEIDDDIEIIHPTADNPDPHHVYKEEVQHHQRRYRFVIQFTHSSTRAAMFMLVAALVALIIANVGWHEPFMAFWNTEITIGFGDAEAEMSLAHIINDILMALFFLLVGIDIKYEMTVGELTNIRQAALPIIAAVGGVLAPIVIYTLFNSSHPEASHGWGVPTATDIAFALGIMSLLGNRVPNGLRVFLSTLAVADDIIAIIVIAIFYGESPSILWLALAAVVFVLLLVMNRARIYSLIPYVIGGILLWLCVYMSGIHSTIAGVLLAFTIPTGSRVNIGSFFSWGKNRMQEAEAVYDEETPIMGQEDYIETIEHVTRVSRHAVPPAVRMEHALYPWVYFAILPLFALTNADVSLVGGDIGAMFTSTVTLGVFFGLLCGKPIGIMLFSFLTVKLHIADLPEHVNWVHMLGAAILGGVGFTMAIFVANLAYTQDYLISEAKLGILSASLVAGVIGFVFLFVQARAAGRRGVSYVTAKGSDVELSTADAEAARASEKFIEEKGDVFLRQEYEEAGKSPGGVKQIIVEEHFVDDDSDEDNAGKRGKRIKPGEDYPDGSESSGGAGGGAGAGAGGTGGGVTGGAGAGKDGSDNNND